MYSNERSVQILISLLKGYGIKNVVISPGGSDAPIIRSFESDAYFSCYSVVDERNAAYVALGLAQECGKPVICLCTAGTAVCNYVPGITEAFYQNIPVIAITSDQHPYLLNQLELQKIPQDKIFGDMVKYEISLPCVKSELDEWQCNRIINEALLELHHHGSGPIHINVPIMETLECTTKELPKERIIERYHVEKAPYENLISRLINKKVLVVCGENLNITEDECRLFEKFFDRFDCVFSVETISNLRGNGCVTTYPATETGAAFNKPELIPDVIISIGNFIASYKLKELLRVEKKSIENWLISESGKLRDPYWSLKYIFEGDYRQFFKYILECEINFDNKHNYYENWNQIANNICLDDLGFSSLSVAKILSEEIPDNSILHTAILNSTRVTQFFKFDKKVRFYSNLGALGIDGCVATFIGHSFATSKLSYLLIGDLSFFYGMNGVSIKGIGNNVRIILLNNAGGEEFKIKLPYPQMEMNEFICAQKERYAKGWVESLGFDYYVANNNDDVRSALDKFAQESEKPMFLEVFLNIDNDSKIIRKIYNDNKNVLIKDRMKQKIKECLPEWCKKAVKKYKNI